MKTIEITNIFAVLNEAKLTKMEDADKFKVIKALRAIKPIAKGYEDFVEDAKNKLKGELVIRNDGGSKLEIKSLQMFTVGLQVSLNRQSLEPGETARLKVTADSKLLKTARSKPRILMITNDPDMPKVIINVTLK